MMFPFVIRMYCALLVAFLVSNVNGLDRKIISQLNPGCHECSTNSTTLVYVRADGDSDTIHQIWDFTRHIPTMLLAVGSLNSSLNIQWDGMEPKVFTWSEQPRYSFGTAMDKLVEYDDLNDNGYINPQYPQKEYSFKHVSWALKESILTDEECMAHVVGTVHSKERDSFVNVKLDLLPFRDYAEELPHLIHTANSSLVDISLVNLTTSKEYNSSRFALHFVMVSTDDSDDTMHYTMRKSLDDEHTPGVFEIIEIKTPSLYSNEEGGYLQFRPVGYTDKERNVASSTMAHISNFNRTNLPQRSTLELFFKDSSRSVLVQDMFVSFGDAGDGFYKKHNYTAWAYTMGYGFPPIEAFSLFVILIISIGLGVPVILALSGVVYVLVRRYRHTNTRTRFTNED